MSKFQNNKNSKFFLRISRKFNHLGYLLEKVYYYLVYLKNIEKDINGFVGFKFHQQQRKIIWLPRREMEVRSSAWREDLKEIRTISGWSYGLTVVVKLRSVVGWIIAISIGFWIHQFFWRLIRKNLIRKNLSEFLTCLFYIKSVNIIDWVNWEC